MIACDTVEKPLGAIRQEIVKGEIFCNFFKAYKDETTTMEGNSSSCYEALLRTSIPSMSCLVEFQFHTI